MRSEEDAACYIGLTSEARVGQGRAVQWHGSSNGSSMWDMECGASNGSIPH
jgi:hypothetical protein